MARAARTVATALAIVGLWCLPAATQGVYGVIGGTVSDSSGAVLPGAIVRVINVDTQVTNTLTTNEAGVYNATNLIPGIYTVEASLSGFRTAVATSVTLEVNANVKVDMALQLGQASESVTVIAEAPLLETQQTNLGQTVTQRQIEQLPSGRNLFSLIPLAAVLPRDCPRRRVRAIRRRRLATLHATSRTSATRASTISTFQCSAI
jgi:hypothetical protein